MLILTPSVKDYGSLDVPIHKHSSHASVKIGINVKNEEINYMALGRTYGAHADMPPLYSDHVHGEHDTYA